MWDLEYDTNELSVKQRETHRENGLVVATRGWGRGEVGVWD